MASIALADDHVLLRKGLASLVQNLGYTVLFEADNGQELIGKMEAGAEPDLVLLDINMPLMDGRALVSYLKQTPATSTIPIVMVTSKGLETDRVWGLRQGAVDAVGAIRGGNRAVDTFMDVNPSFHPPMYVALKTVDAGHGEGFDIGIALRSLSEVRQVLAAMAAAELVTCNADVVEGEIAIVEAHGLPGLHREGVRKELAMRLINQRRRGGHVGGTRAAFDSDDDIREATIGGDTPS